MNLDVCWVFVTFLLKIEDRINPAHYDTRSDMGLDDPSDCTIRT